MAMVDFEELVKQAIETEASRKPNEKIIIGNIEMTYAELKKKIDEGDETVLKLIVKPMAMVLKKDKSFSARLMRLVASQ